MIPSKLFNLRRSEPKEEMANRGVGQKRGSSFLSNIPEFDIDIPDACPTETIRKAMTILSNTKDSFVSYKGDHDDCEVIRKAHSDVHSVSTASTASMRCEESDIETDNEDEVPITSVTPDSLFIVQGKDFPCHAKMLSTEAPMLLDILSRDGAIERKTKRRRTTSTDHQGVDEPWSTPSGITVARLPDEINADFFEVLMEYLYTREIRVKLPEGYHEDNQQEDPWLMDNCDCNSFDDFEEDENEEILIDLLPSLCGGESNSSSATPLTFLQGAFSLADRYGCASLKKAIEHKIYDEFLFSFTAQELLNWADRNKCVFLREKAINRLSASTSKA